MEIILGDSTSVSEEQRRKNNDHADRIIKAATADAEQYAKEARELQTQYDLLAMQRRVLEQAMQEKMEALFQAKEAAYDSKGDAMEAALGRIQRPFEAAPDDTINDLVGWSRAYRHRAWRSAFNGGFHGATGTRDLFLLLSLAAVMERQNARVFEADMPALVRIAAMDCKTVRSGLESLRESGHLLRVRSQSYALADDNLPASNDCPEPFQHPFAQRLMMGDHGNTAFGGHHGLKTTEIRIWSWLLLNPGLTRYQIAKGAEVGKNTARRSVDSLADCSLVRMDAEDKCQALTPKKRPDLWLSEYADRKNLSVDAAEFRVLRAAQPDHLSKKSKNTVEAATRVCRLTQEQIDSLDLGDWEFDDCPASATSQVPMPPV